MKPTVMAVMCHKGGVGKTSTIIGLCDGIHKIHPDKKILVVDSDEQSNIKTIFGIKLRNSEGGLASILLDNVNPENITCEVRKNIHVILSGGRSMREFERVFSNVPEAELILRRRFENLKEFDYVLIDTPPALSLISSNVATFAQYILMPCSPDLLSVVGIKNTITFIQNLEKHFAPKNINVSKILGVVPTLHDVRRNLDLDILDDLDRLADANLLNGGVIFDPIRVDVKVKTAQVRRKLLSEAFPNAKATQDYVQLAKSISERIEYLKENQDKEIEPPIYRPITSEGEPIPPLPY